MTTSQQNIDQLIARCKKMDSKAQFEVYNLYCKAMYNVAYRIVKDRHFAQDVMQEGFLRAFTKINDYKQDVAFGAWLKKIIVNYSIDFYKKTNKLQLEDFEKSLYKVEDSEINIVDIVDFNDLKVKQILDVIASLKESYSVILTLFYIEGYDQEEISDILNISNANCRTTLSRAKEKLKQKLTEL